MQKQGREIVGLAGNGRSTEAAEAAINLVQAAMTEAHQFRMQQETTGNYDLSALKVDASTLTNSETGWEREN